MRDKETIQTFEFRLGVEAGDLAGKAAAELPHSKWLTRVARSS
jgi:hypothetical protein